MPEELTVTDLIPDHIVVDKARKVVDMFEITIPAEKRIEAVHFLTDIHDYNVIVEPF